MPNNWKTYKLGELYKSASGLSKSSKEFGFGNPFVTFKNVFYNYFLPSELDSLVNTNEKEIKNCSVKEGDVFLTRTSETLNELGMSSVALKDYPNATFNGFCKRLRILDDAPTRIDSTFFGFYLRSDLFRNEVTKLASITTRASLNNDAIYSISVTLPEYNEQNEIGKILKSINDKIENNLAINKTLEEMAMALYKHWFVDFGPFQDGEFVESELGRIPKGWEVKTIYDVCDVVYGAAFKSKLFNENKEGFPLIRIRDLKTLKPQYYTLENHPKKTIIKAGDVVAGMDAEFDPYFWLGEDGVLNQRVVHFKPKTNFSRMFIYHSVLPWLKFYAGAKVGTTVIHLGKSDIDNFKIAVPVDFKSIKLFNEQAENYLEQIVNNSKENQTLTQLRDTLLPKLISGAVRLKEFVSSEK